MVKSTAVETPASAEQLARILHEAETARHTVLTVGGGRALGMGNPAESCDVEVHTTQLDRVIEHSRSDMVVSVEAGVTLEALQAHLAKAGQFLPIDPFSAPGHTIGGVLASGWTGPMRLRYGSPRDFLIGVRVALPDGRLVTAGGRVVKNVSGYDMMKLHYGALGSLGVIVAASFKVFPRPLHDVTVSGEGAWEDVRRASSTVLAPSALEIFSDGRVLARFTGNRGAVERAVRELGWPVEDTSIWERHMTRSPARWARISSRRDAIRGLVEALPRGAGWWASPGLGVAHWAIASDSASVRDMRGKAEEAGGALVMLAAPDEFMREVDAWGTRPATLDLMRRIKASFDPEGILNPGRFVV